VPLITDEGHMIDGEGLPLADPRMLQDDAFGGYEDYFGFDETKQYFLPDGKQYIEYKPLNEGARVRFEAQTSRDVKFNRRTEDAAIKMNPGEDRHALIIASVTGWHMVQRNGDRWQPVAFTSGRGGTFEQWLAKANPKIINGLYEAIRKANGWMIDEMTVDAIDEELKRLNDLRAIVLEREMTGKVS
jgi:hypothetical protein